MGIRTGDVSKAEWGQKVQCEGCEALRLVGEELEGE